MKKLIRLQDNDWDKLFISGTVEVGSQTIQIEPLTLKEFGPVLKQLKSIDWSKANVDFDALDEDSNLINLFAILLEKAPHILEIATKIHREDLSKLPLTKAIELLAVVLDVNLQSQEGLFDNLGKLMGLVGEVKART